MHRDDRVMDIKGRKIGGGNVVVMGGRCGVEWGEEIDEIGEVVKGGGGQVVRGGGFKSCRGG